MTSSISFIALLATLLAGLPPIFGPTPEPSPTPTPFVPQPGPTLRPAPPFVPADVAPYENGGTGVVVGRIAIPTKLRGSLQFGGVRVHLVPDVPYGRWAAEWYHATTFDRTNVDSNLDFFSSTQYADTDDQGYFRMEKVPPGRYLIYAEPYFAVYNGARPAATTAPAVDPDGNYVTTTVPTMTYEHAKSENFFMLGNVTVANDQQTAANLSIVEDLVSTTDPVPLNSFVLSSPPPISTTQLQQYARGGNAVVSGRLLVRLQGAFRKNYYGGYTVSLWPATPYAAWLLDRQQRSWNNTEDKSALAFSDRRFAQAMRYTKTDKKGYFRFENLPALPFVVHIEMDLLRQHYIFVRGTDYVQEDQYGNQVGPTIHDSGTNHNFTCDRTGLLAATVKAEPGREVSVPLSLLVTHIDNGADCRMFHSD